MKLIIGIDPGMSGAIALLWGGCPPITRDMQPSADGKRTVVHPEIIEAIRQRVVHVSDTTTHVFIEDINATPKFGSQTSFKMGRALGALETWASMIPGASIEYVKPMKWKKAFGLVLAKKLNANEAKRVSLECARRLFPQVDLHRVADHNKAEALLIAEYGRRIIG